MLKQLSILGLSALLAMASIGCGSKNAPQGIAQAQISSNSAKPAQNANSSKKTIYYCGALTKAGTPCRHRVAHEGDRCWQHQGK